MKIKIEDTQVEVVARDGYKNTFNYGSLHIDEAGFQAVDNIVEATSKHIASDEEVFVESVQNNVAAKMIGRKIEDKIKREVSFIYI